MPAGATPKIIPCWSVDYFTGTSVRSFNAKAWLGFAMFRVFLPATNVISTGSAFCQAPIVKGIGMLTDALALSNVTART